QRAPLLRRAMVAPLFAQVHRLSTTHSLAASINRLGFTQRSDPRREEKTRRGAGLALRTLQCDSLQGAAHRDAGQALARSRWPSTLRDPRWCLATPLGPAPPESSATGPAPVRRSGWQGAC